MDEERKTTKKFRKEVNAGIVSLILLAILDRAAEPMYGYQIAKSIESSDQDVSMMKQGALYPVLRSLESAGLASSRVEPSVSGPPRRYYEITDRGRATLAEWTQIWMNTSRIVTSVLGGGNND